MTPRHPVPRRPAAPEPFAALAPLLAAESEAEAAASGADPRDLRQAVWLRLLERLDGPGAPADPADWLRRAVREEARRARRTAARELPYDGDPAPDPRSGPGPGPAPEWAAVQAERRRALRAAVRRTPVRCQRLLSAMLSPNDLSYREIAGRLGVPQGSLGPMRSRCLGCLRRMLTAEAPPPAPR
ncbi:sigma-70 family RNA polymerase sigma factor [Streptomyces somaliensis]|uniref:sigma-70 family RNA polymerase sigma factor n=1 Tax=Streptomyces somaliensis TaxID=78355 RepID=UPI0020CBEF9A|nr:sigma-70 family RNA polymerase sigma factor [Streptomyces somaliensis]MCP9946451.1 sigma-70 family RNA polymerase sigma factor [Streptomyces somaliensis]MCP9960405.1 sigma-70 family RNA polymerase sigma factor [Streptomyces somaliensis]